MDTAIVDKLRFCSYCPNICRIYFPTSGISQKESMTCSALAYLGLAVINGFVEYNRQIADTLSNLAGCEACKGACPYNFDIPGCLRNIVEEYSHK